MTQVLNQNGNFFKEPPERLADGTLIQTIHYFMDGEEHEYTAEGEDLQDLERDWAYKYLELLE